MENIQKRRRRKRTPRIFILLLLLLQIIVFFLGYAVGYNCSGNVKNISEPVIPADASAQPQDETALEEQVNSIMEAMTIDEMVYQMMFVTPESITEFSPVVQAGEATKAALESYPVGGIIYFSQNFENPEQTKTMIKNTQSFSKIPLFIGVDEEGGRVSRIGSNANMGVKKLPPMKEIGDTKEPLKAYDAGVSLAKDLCALGFNVDFAPDSDVLINSSNTEIGDRSFGSEPENVSIMVENIVKGMEINGLSATLKHFPGHGSTQTDSHKGTSVSTRTLDEMRTAEFLPFISGINAGADFIMVSHMTPENATEEKVPASVSKEIITDILLGELAYDGIVITDAFNMGAIANNYSVGDAAIKAVSAGADMILMSPDVKAAHDAIVAAVADGRLTEERIKESVRKIITLKVEKGMFE